MRFLVDAQLPPALGRWIVEHNHEAEHVADLVLADAEDDAIAARAAETHAVIVSKDEDFAHRALLRRDAPPVVWVRMGNSSTASLLRRFESVFPDIIKRLEERERLIEIV